MDDEVQRALRAVERSGRAEELLLALLRRPLSRAVATELTPLATWQIRRWTVEHNTRDGRMIPLPDMDDDHLLNCLRAALAGRTADGGPFRLLGHYPTYVREAELRGLDVPVGPLQQSVFDQIEADLVLRGRAELPDGTVLEALPGIETEWPADLSGPGLYQRDEYVE